MQRDVWPGIRTLPVERVRSLADTLERRAAWPGQKAIRSAWLDCIGVRPGMRALDVGCGSGTVARVLAERVGPTGAVVGVDPSPDLLALAREMADAEGVGDRITFVEGAADNPGIPDGSFDLAVAVTVFSHLPDPPGALAGMRRAVRAGGVVSVFDQDYFTLTFDHPDRDTTQTVVRANARGLVNGSAGRHLYRWLNELGLKDVDARAFPYVEHGQTGYLVSLAERGAAWAVAEGELTREKRDEWLVELRAMGERGVHFAALTYIAAWGTVG